MTQSPLLWNNSGSTLGWGSGGFFSVDVLEDRPGLMVFRVSGEGAGAAFKHEPGGHRWQRIPPNEKRGRVHTSTVTVAVLREPEEKEFYLDPADLELKTMRGSGPGGQNRNKLETCVVLTHLPSKTAVRVDSERSQLQNKRLAMGLMRAKLLEVQQCVAQKASAAERKAQVGCGARGDKTWTCRCQDGVVTYHGTGQKFRLKDYLRGEWDVKDST